MTGGLRYFETENSLKGFFGFSAVFSGMTGESQCFDPEPFRTAPCTNLDKTVKEDGNTKRLNVTFHATDDVMLYATWSEGFRPGGINRQRHHSPVRGGLPDQLRDRLQDHLGQQPPALQRRDLPGRLGRLPVFVPRPNGLTEIRNAGQARIKGFEADIVWAVSEGFTLSTSAVLPRREDDSRVLRHALRWRQPRWFSRRRWRSRVIGTDPSPIAADPRAPNGTIMQAPKGQELPVQPKFKGNAIGRYEFAMGEPEAHVQAAWVYQGSAWSDLRTAERELLGKQPSYSIVDFAGGIDNESWGLELFVKNAFDERAEIARYAECSTFQPRPTGRSVQRVAAVRPAAVHRHQPAAHHRDHVHQALLILHERPRARTPAVSAFHA